MEMSFYFRPQLLEAQIALTSVNYHTSVLVLMLLNQALAPTMLGAAGPKLLCYCCISFYRGRQENPEKGERTEEQESRCVQNRFRRVLRSHGKVSESESRHFRVRLVLLV